MVKIKLHYFEGMKLHGDNACNCLGFEKYNHFADSTLPAMFWLYCENDYKLLASHKGKKFVFWHNADVMALMRMFSKYIPVVRDQSIVHVCHNELLRDELASMGIYSLIRPIFWGDITKYVPKKIAQTKDCYMTANAGRGAEYGEHIMNTLAWMFKDWNFHIFGIEPSISIYCDNLKYYGWITEEEMDRIDESFMICFRFNQHDGFSQTVMKARMRGQAAITSVKYPGVTDSYKTFDELSELFRGHSPLLDIPISGEYFNNFDFLK
jgi:hypothetical protein